jgi:cyanuric acid amidohydrolase
VAIEVAKVELKSVQDASGLEECITGEKFSADQVVVVIGKTEGNGGVNDFTRTWRTKPSVASCKSTARGLPMKSLTFPWCGRAVATA